MKDANTLNMQGNCFWTQQDLRCLVRAKDLDVALTVAAHHKRCLKKGTNVIDYQHCFLQAEELDAALVVMAAHHKGQLLKYLVGSVTKYCVNKCRQTVLVAH